MRTLCVIFIGIFLLQFAEGKLPYPLYGEETLHSYANELLKPLMSRTNDLNNTLQDYWNRYDENMDTLSSRFSNLNRLESMKGADSRNDTCKDLQDTMANAQNTVNNATVLLVEVFQKMAYIIDNSPSCATINIFSAASCIAHKAQNIRDVYREYKDQIASKEIAAAKAMNQILIEFINCLRRL